MAFVDDDLGAFFSGLDEVTVEFQGQQCLGHFDTPADIFEGGSPLGGVEAQRYCVEIPADAFTPRPVAPQDITVNGILYAIVRRKLSDDGRVLNLELAL